MALFSAVRRYLLPALRLARFMVVWTTITLTLWVLAFPVIAREVFKGLLRKNATRRTANPWARTQTETPNPQHHGRRSTSNDGASRPTAPRRASTDTANWSRSNATRSRRTSVHGNGDEVNGGCVPPKSQPSAYHTHAHDASMNGRPAYTPRTSVRTPPSPPRSTSPPAASRAHYTHADGARPTTWHV
ncbi:hypothetical protein THASP1DRAFT_22514 [Thamnocephalis sphaerospora]|uniref:Uncharacterized protein n=1 Tax=Thamnocephalis sphaerospora TaxID=78915 RepID=A0A4P9XTZ7_9FUNG|nr:hypothetical protein THASP1DRAFT_22514 [Thamnocephalis sphaerospora]|eukprot:RKP09678.1 hypothetical protein THASP1DRAFT_22514 [Thamnocephalis sphaerospora]